jgi:hypothetical protein
MGPEFKLLYCQKKKEKAVPKAQSDPAFESTLVTLGIARLLFSGLKIPSERAKGCKREAGTLLVWLKWKERFRMQGHGPWHLLWLLPA